MRVSFAIAPILTLMSFVHISTYDGSYVPKIVGEYKLDVKLGADGIADSPFTVQVTPAAPNAANTEASGDGISKANTDEPAKFSIQTKDEFGNNCVEGTGLLITAVPRMSRSSTTGRLLACTTVHI